MKYFLPFVVIAALPLLYMNCARSSDTGNATSQGPESIAAAPKLIEKFDCEYPRFNVRYSLKAYSNGTFEIQCEIYQRETGKTPISLECPLDHPYFFDYKGMERNTLHGVTDTRPIHYGPYLDNNTPECVTEKF